MILRNTAGQTLLIGPLLAVADGAAQTAGAALTVVKDGAAAASTGTLTHVSNGVWMYAPTQAETDCATLGLVLTKALSAAVALNAVTTRFPSQTTGVLPAFAAGAAGGLAKFGDAMALTAAERLAVAAAVLDLANGVEAGLTPRQCLRLAAAVLGGQVTGAQSGSETFKAAGNPGTTRVVSVCDAVGNRTTVTLSLGS